MQSYCFFFFYQSYFFDFVLLIWKIIRNFAFTKAVPRLYCWLISRIDERKVRAAKGAPLAKIQVIGDSKCRKKKITALPFGGVRVRR